MSESPLQVAVIGAGAAGLVAAAEAAIHGGRVLLIEKNRKTGVKILMSGGTRCNLTHHAAPRDMARAFGACAFVMLTVILAIGPLARLDRRFLPLLYNRRHF